MISTLKMVILTLKVVNLTYYNLKGSQFKVILTLKVVILTFKMVIFDLKVIKNGFDILAKFQISEFRISKIFWICLNISISTPSLVIPAAPNKLVRYLGVWFSSRLSY